MVAITQEGHRIILFAWPRTRPRQQEGRRPRRRRGGEEEHPEDETRVAGELGHWARWISYSVVTALLFSVFFFFIEAHFRRCLGTRSTTV